MKTLLPILSLFLLVQISCNKDDDDTPAPPITQENTFSCKINGKTFVPAGHGGFPINYSGIEVPVFTENKWQINIGDGNNKILLYLYQINKTGTYSFSESDGDGFFINDTKNLIEFSANGNLTPTHHSTKNTGSFNIIEVIPEKKIILEFETLSLANNENSSDEITLIKGKLNINLETLNQ